MHCSGKVECLNKVVYIVTAVLYGATYNRRQALRHILTSGSDETGNALQECSKNDVTWLRNEWSVIAAAGKVKIN